MANTNTLAAFWPCLFIVIALFYGFRLAISLSGIRRYDLESEIGHSLMAIGMALMLAPPAFQTPELIRWNISLFTLASLWFAGRLLAHRPLLTILTRRTDRERATLKADAIHLFTYIGMAYMFLEIASMALSMTQTAIYLNCSFFVAFAFLLLAYGREISGALQTNNIDWLKLGADLAHLCMNGVMSWMFIEMISMSMRMGAL